MFGNISPDGKWKIIIEDNKLLWIDLTKRDSNSKFTTEEIVEATKKIMPELWNE